MARVGPLAVAHGDRAAAGEDRLATNLQDDRFQGPLGSFEAILACGPPAFVARPSGEVLSANDAYAALAQSIEAGRCGRPGEPALIPTETLARAHETGVVVEAVHEYRCAEGLRLIHARCWALPGEDAVAGLCEDRGEDAAALHQARQAKARFDDIARLTSDWVWEVDHDFNFTFASTRVADVIGMPARLLVGQNLFDCGQFEGFPEANRIDHPYPDSRTPFKNVVYRIVGVDDRPRLFALSGVPVFEDATGRFLGYRGTATDISLQAEAENRITEAQTRLIHALETMPQGFAVFDSEDRVVLCNSRYEEFLASDGSMIEPGIPYEMLLRAAAKRGLFSGGSAEVETFIMEQVVRHGMATREFEIQLADGRWVQIASEMTEDSGIIEVWSDISRIKKREAELRKAEEIARRAHQQSELANRAKSEFLATMSHELRTPLNAIIGFSEILKGELFGPMGNAQYKEYAGDIHDSGTHLLGLINDILEFSKAEAGKLKLVERTVDTEAIVAACLRLLEPRAKEAEVTLEVDLPADLPKIRADETKLKQIIINLLSNGIKFTSAGGKVSLSAEASMATGFFIKVSDTGIGIAEEDIPKALSAFGQVDSALSRRYEGTGLGLPLSLSLAEMHGGSLSLESEVGVGTTVTVRMPRERIISDD